MKNTNKTVMDFAVTISPIVILLLLTYFASRGIDLTDQGYLIGNKSAWKEPLFLPIWGSAVISSSLFSIFQDWAFFAQKLLSQFSVILIFLIYLLVRKSKGELSTSEVCALAFSIFWSGRSFLGEWSSYNILSGFFISAAILTFDYSLKSKKSLHLNIGISFLLISFLIKFTNITSFIIIAIYVIFKTHRREHVFKLFQTLLAWLLIIPIIFFVVLSFPSIKEFVLEGVVLFKESLSFTKVHTFSHLASRTLQDLKTYSGTAFIFSIFLLLILIFSKLPSQIKKYSLPMLFLIFLGIQFHLRLFERNGFFIVYIIGLIIVITDKKAINLRFLGLATLAFFGFSSIGSSLALGAAFIAEPLASFILITYFSNYSNRYFDRKIIFSIFYLLITTGIINKFIYTYRDGKKISLNHSSKIPRLAGVYSSKEKIATIEAIFETKKKFFLNAKTSIIYPSAPLLHYALDIRPSLPNPWVTLYFPDQIKNLFNQMTEKPEVIIRLLQNPRSARWPLDKRSLEYDLNYETIKVIDQFVEDNNYVLVHESFHFRVYLSRSYLYD